MSRSIQKNFRGFRALVIMAPDSGCQTLEQTLRKLGLEVTVARTLPDNGGASVPFDVIFFDADDWADAALDESAVADRPLIALIGSEAPSRLARVIQNRAASHILKPVRSSGIFTALLLAVNEHAERMRQKEQVQTLNRRLAGRRIVTKAVMRLITGCGLSEEDAYEWLRREAMQRRIPMEDMARHAIGLGPDPAQEAGPQRGRATRSE
jgi:AmiR/NasT family two-component response regulator